MADVALPNYTGSLRPALWSGFPTPNQIAVGDVIEKLKALPDESVNCVVTSPPYFGLRDYGVQGQVGLEESYQEYVQKMVEIFREVRRILKGNGTLWLNIGDSYAGSGKGRSSDGTHGVSNSDKQASNVGAVMGRLTRAASQPGLKPKDLMGIPWRVAFALQDDGWWLRADNIWFKPNTMTESVKDRSTKSHEYVFHMSKSSRYYYDRKAVEEKVVGDGRVKYTNGWDPVTGYQAGDPGKNGHRKYETRNRRSVWVIPTESFDGEFCTACKTYYTRRDRAELPELKDGEKRSSVCRCGRHDAWMSHFATFPQRLAAVCILAGCPEGGIVLDPFIGSGTTGLVAVKARRLFFGIELHSDFAEMARQRIGLELAQEQLPMPLEKALPGDPEIRQEDLL